MDLLTVLVTLQKILLNMLEDLAPIISIFLDFINVCVETRFIIGWFLNINPYFEPFITLWTITDPFIWFGKGAYPRIFNMELAPMINHRLITVFRQNLDAFVYYRKTHKSNIEPDDIGFYQLVQPMIDNYFFEHFSNGRIIHSFFIENNSILEITLNSI
jgi:hypothetical protein